MGPPGDLLRASSESLGASWGPLGAQGSKCPFGSLVWAPSWSRLGGLLGRIGGLLGRLGALLGRLGALLGASWAVLGRELEASWVVLERREAEKARIPKSFKNLRKSNDFCFLGTSWQGSWRPLGASWRPFGPSGGHLGPSWRHPGLSWWPGWASWAVMEALESPREAPWPPRDLRE